MTSADITRLLILARDGRPERLAAVFEALYPDLLRLAGSRMSGNESTFTPTVLVHELFLRITQGAPLALADRNHFFAVAARAMRWIMVEHARKGATAKRGGGQPHASLDERIAGAPAAMTDLLLVDQGLEALEAISPQRRQVVELRYFAGLEFGEIASVLDVSERTVHREWERARAFLQALLDEERDGS